MNEYNQIKDHKDVESFDNILVNRDVFSAFLRRLSEIELTIRQLSNLTEETHTIIKAMKLDEIITQDKLNSHCENCNLRQEKEYKKIFLTEENIEKVITKIIDDKMTRFNKSVETIKNIMYLIGVSGLIYAIMQFIKVK